MSLWLLSRHTASEILVVIETEFVRIKAILRHILELRIVEHGGELERPEEIVEDALLAVDLTTKMLLLLMSSVVYSLVGTSTWCRLNNFYELTIWSGSRIRRLFSKELFHEIAHAHERVLSSHSSSLRRRSCLLLLLLLRLSLIPRRQRSSTSITTDVRIS